MAPTFGEEDPLVLAATAVAVAVDEAEDVLLVAGVGTNGTAEVTGTGLAVEEVTRTTLDVVRTTGTRDDVTRITVAVGRTAPPVVEGSSMVGSVGSIGSIGKTKWMSTILKTMQGH